MGIATDILDDWEASLAALQWQLEAGVDVVFGDETVNRYEAGPPPEIPQAMMPAAALKAAPEPAPLPKKVDPVDVALGLAARAQNLDELHQAILDFDLCELKKGAKNTVFASGNAGAKVMILGEAPTREEDMQGQPFAGASAVLLQKMFAAIGLSADHPDPAQAIYCAAPVFWRPLGVLQNEDMEMLKPFLLRHISLADPDVIVVMGNTPFAMLGGQGSVLRARGTWFEALGKPVLPMLHPSVHLSRPLTKREAWADLLALGARLK